MRRAPKWRSWIPTSRQIRFVIEQALVCLFPRLRHRYNYFADGADLNAPAIKQLSHVEECSAHPLPEPVRQFFTEYGALEQSRYPLPITPLGKTTLQIVEIPEVMVLGKTGATIIKQQNRQIESAARNTMRFARLKDRSILTVAFNALGMEAGHRHYYHFLCDVAFPILHALKDLEPRAYHLTLLIRANLPAFQEQFYTHLAKGFESITLLECRKDERIHCQKLIYCKTALNCEYRAPASEAAAGLVAEHYRGAYGLSALRKPERKLYIARRDAKTRKLLNEDDLLAKLEPLGFESIAPGELSHEEQVKLFSSATTVIGTHGAGLTNILFTQPQCHLIEIFPQDYVQSAYAWLSHTRRGRYTPVLGKKSGAHQHFSLSQEAMQQLVNAVRDTQTS